MMLKEVLFFLVFCTSVLSQMKTPTLGRSSIGRGSASGIGKAFKMNSLSKSSSTSSIASMGRQSPQKSRQSPKIGRHSPRATHHSPHVEGHSSQMARQSPKMERHSPGGGRHSPQVEQRGLPSIRGGAKQNSPIDQTDAARQSRARLLTGSRLVSIK